MVSRTRTYTNNAPHEGANKQHRQLPEQLLVRKSVPARLEHKSDTALRSRLPVVRTTEEPVRLLRHQGHCCPRLPANLSAQERQQFSLVRAAACLRQQRCQWMVRRNGVQQPVFARARSSHWCGRKAAGWGVRRVGAMPVDDAGVHLFLSWGLRTWSSCLDRSALVGRACDARSQETRLAGYLGHLRLFEYSTGGVNNGGIFLW